MEEAYGNRDDEFRQKVLLEVWSGEKKYEGGGVRGEVVRGRRQGRGMGDEGERGK